MHSDMRNFFYQDVGSNLQDDVSMVTDMGIEDSRPNASMNDEFQGSDRRAPSPSLSPRLLKPAPAARLVTAPRTPVVKRRKGQDKRVICIPALAADQESNKTSSVVVPSDLWAWRKYGQKPIKGSPYPRGYYRCSSSKGCSARKQVERSRSDPNMLVITYTSEHDHPCPTHRNSLAGSTRSSYPSKKSTSQTSSPSASSKQEAQQDDHMFISSASSPPQQAVKEENPDYERVFDQSCEPLMLEYSDDMELFDGLARLEPDPMSFFFSSRELKLEEEGEIKALDPLSYFDWDGN